MTTLRAWPWEVRPWCVAGGYRIMRVRWIMEPNGYTTEEEAIDDRTVYPTERAAWEAALPWRRTPKEIGQALIVLGRKCAEVGEPLHVAISTGLVDAAKPRIFHGPAPETVILVHAADWEAILADIEQATSVLNYVRPVQLDGFQGGEAQRLRTIIFTPGENKGPTGASPGPLPTTQDI
jgi:hypothetical protein